MVSIGSILKNRYKIIKLIGIGGMSKVFLARDLTTNNPVAIKVLDESISLDVKFIERFKREADVGMVLDHANIVKVFDSGKEDNVFFIVMEFINGLNLRQYIKQNGVLPWEKALGILMQVLSALSYAYKKGIQVHRDIKPENIMIDAVHNTVKVTDFGVAKTEGSTLTQSTIFFTSHYAAPEQLMPSRYNRLLNKSTDMFDLGIVLYEMITGKLPFYGETQAEIFQCEISKSPIPPSVVNSQIPVWLSEVILTALQPDPKFRYQSPDEMGQDIRERKQNKQKTRERTHEPIPTSEYVTKIIRTNPTPSNQMESKHITPVNITPIHKTLIQRNIPKKRIGKKSSSAPLIIALSAFMVLMVVGLGVLFSQIFFKIKPSGYVKNESVKQQENGNTPGNIGNQKPSISNNNDNDKNVEYGNTSGNIANGTFSGSSFVLKGDWIYYYSMDYSGNNLFKIRTDGTGGTRLDFNFIFELNIVGDWIYYQNFHDEDKIYKMRTDGSEVTRLNNDKSYFINVVGDWIFYSNWSDAKKLYKIRTDGSGKTKLNDDGTYDLIVIGDWIYYANDGLYKIRTDGSGKTKLNDDGTNCINVVGDWIYYINDPDGCKLYKIRTDGSGRGRVNVDNCKYINAVGDWIYYCNYSDGKKLYKIRADGSGRTKLNDDRIDHLFAGGDWIYYENGLPGSYGLYKIRTDGTGRQKFD